MAARNHAESVSSGRDPQRRRLDEADRSGVAWRRWGPYLSERQWGTVREDCSSSGDAWSYFTHDQARSRAYRWGEDGLAGISDDKQRLCLALALWNGRDPLLKERLVPPGFRVRAAGHRHLRRGPLFRRVRRVRQGGAGGPAGRDHRPQPGPDEASLHLLPTLWFRHTWSWAGGTAVPSLRQVEGRPGSAVIRAEHEELGRRWLYCAGEVPLLFTENETNNERVFGSANSSPYVNDGIDRYVVHGEQGDRRPADTDVPP